MRARVDKLRSACFNFLKSDMNTIKERIYPESGSLGFNGNPTYITVTIAQGVVYDCYCHEITMDVTFKGSFNATVPNMLNAGPYVLRDSIHRFLNQRKVFDADVTCFYLCDT